MPTAKLLHLLAHPITQDAMKSLANGAHPKGVLAGIAGDLFAQEVAKALGAKETTNLRKKPVEEKAPTTAAAPGVKRRAKVEVVPDEEVIDAEYTVIDVTPKASKNR